MQDVEKTEIQRDTSAGRKRRRNRMRPIYGLLIMVMVVGIGIALSMTVFFNIQEIRIAGYDSQYSKEEIAQASGVHTGDNLMRLDQGDVKAHILDRLVFVEDVTIDKQFPDVLVITVTPSKPAYNMVDESGTLQVSAAGKILINGPDIDAALPTFTGFESEVREPGEMLASKDEQKDKVFEELSKQMARGLSCPVTAVDMEDKHEITLTFDNRIVFSMGNWSDLTYKITLAETVLEQLSAEKAGFLTMVGDNQCSYRDKDAVEKQTTAPLVTLPTDTYGNTIVLTDEEGNPVSTETTTTTVMQNG